MPKERLQKIIAHAGICSRREAEKLIRDEKVRVNGKIAKLGDQADIDEDSIKVNGKLITQSTQQKVYYLFHKPSNVLCRFGNSEDKVPTLSDYFMKVKTRIYPVNILEQSTEGLVLLTNDGDVKAQLADSDQISRTYHVKTKKHHSEKAIQKLGTGMTREGRRIQPVSVKAIKRYENKTLIEIVFNGLGPLKLKDYFEKKGFLVEKIKCARLGQYRVNTIPKGQWVAIPREALKLL